MGASCEENVGEPSAHVGRPCDVAGAARREELCSSTRSGPRRSAASSSATASPASASEDLPRIDAVLVSHNHRDHMDAPTLKRLPRRPSRSCRPGWAVIFASCSYANAVEGLGWWQEHCTRRHRRHLRSQSALEPSRPERFELDTTVGCGFVVAGGDRRVYHSGATRRISTGFADIGQRLGPIDVALLPIGAYDPEWFMRKQHMNPEDAVHAFRDLKARRSRWPCIGARTN